VCTSRDRHADLTAEFVQLAPHPALGKWLYLSQREEEFEQIARAVVEGLSGEICVWESSPESGKRGRRG